MEQTLLVQDYVLVKKWSYGLRLPFSENWLLGPWAPQRGDIVVFRDGDGKNRFLVKRVIGLPGDRVSMDEKGVISINGSPFRYQLLESEDEDFSVRIENNGQRSYRVQYFSDMEQEAFGFQVPQAEFFVMGDNRNMSMDSRYYGGVGIHRLMGKLAMIWLSCQDSGENPDFLCSPENFRMERLFLWVP